MESRVKLVGAIVMALSMPSIWETRSSSVMAAESQKSSTSTKDKSGKALSAKGSSPKGSAAKGSSSKNATTSQSSKQSDEKRETDELNNILLPAAGGSETTFSPGAVKAPRAETSGPVGGTLPSIGDAGEPVSSDAVNGAAPSNADVATDGMGNLSGTSGTSSAQDSGATQDSGAAQGSSAQGSAAAQDSAWPGEEESGAPPAPPVDAKNDANPPPLSAVIEKDDGIQLKAQQALTEAEKNKKLIGEAIAKHGSCGLFLVTYMNGPWTVDRTLKGSSGEAAGLKTGDTIISIDGRYTTGMKIRDVYFTATGYRGQYRSFVINRDGVIKTISVPLWGILDMKDRRTQYIEYYWYLLYHNLMSVQAYNRAVAPFLYFKVPVFKPMPVLKGK